MNAEFAQEVRMARSSPTKRPDVQQYARAIQQSIPPMTPQETEGDLAYPYPGKGVSGESSN